MLALGAAARSFGRAGLAVKHPGVLIEILSQAAAMNMAVSLIAANKWFEMTPLPADCWEFVIKDEPGVDVPEFCNSEWHQVWLDESNRCIGQRD